ncbi:MAG TPA: glycosyltransferase, partial [Flavitalea sp.]|nr:glycosyltransferase [Flavitalea sp.]
MTIVIFLCFVLMIVYGRQIDAYRRAWNSIPVLEFPAIPGSIPLVRVSVLVAVRNEEETLPVLFTALAAQDYPKTLLQLIFIDDHSTDRSGDLLEGFSQQRENLLVLRLPEGLESKKKAIEAGIQAASGELIITTDADSVQPQTWISTIVACYSSTEGKFIAAPVKMKARWSLLGIFQTLDFITLQGITGAAVSKGMHALCNGANLAYTREAFLEVGGFEGVDQLPSGDDVFLMQKVFRVYPTGVRYLKSPLATVETPTEKTWG